MAGHGCIKQTLIQLSHLFYWPKIHVDIKAFIEHCVLCQQIKYSTQASMGLLQPLPIPSKVSDDITMNFIVGLPCPGESPKLWFLLTVWQSMLILEHYLQIVQPEKWLNCLLMWLLNYMDIRIQ